MDVLQALWRRGGAARWDQLLGMGITAAQVRTALHRGTVTRVAHGVYALPTAPESALAAARYRGVLTCVSAFHQWGLPLVSRPGQTHLAVPADRNVVHPPANVVIHRGHWCLEPGAGSAGPVNAASAFEHATRCLSPREILAAADCALARGLITRDEFVFTGRAARPIGNWLRASCDSRAQSILESFARFELVGEGFRVVPQAWVPGAGAVDLLVNGAVVVETDGKDFHERDAEFAEDRRRDRAIQALGLDVLRFTYADVVHKRGTVSSSVRRVLETRRFTGAPWPTRRQPA